ncbi:MAG TPA: glycosyltransferase family 2 protein [Steroidobacteraceae bacterium]|nr:glycosyltransferase family 2 protein [Steroidobacteraceae bacterium]
MIVTRLNRAIKLSVVVPCFNEEEALPLAAAELEAVLRLLMEQGLVASDSNLWLIDDGSTDATWALIEALAASSDLFVGMKLSRNRGHQNALLAGLLSADGEAIVSIDADLQDDTAAIERMVSAHLGGYEIVYGVRRARDKDTFFKRWTALGYYRALRMLGADIMPNHADFRLMGRAAIEALRDFGEVNLFLRGIVPQLGFRSTSVFYERRARVAGESKYPLGKMLRLALDGVTSFSAVPLRLIAALGGLVCLFSLLMVLWVLFIRLFTDRALPGWASTTVPIYFLGGVQLLCMGIIGEYVAKIYTETKSRPRYVVEKVARRIACRPVALASGVLDEPPEHLPAADATESPGSVMKLTVLTNQSVEGITKF